MAEGLEDLITSVGMYDPSEVILIGAHLVSESQNPVAQGGDDEGLSARDRQEGLVKVQSDLVRSLLIKCHPLAETAGSQIEVRTDPSVVIIYAYSYEGHSYRLPKPRIMVVEGRGEPYEQGGGSSGKLFMWRMSKHSHTVSIEVESGSVETLVLEGNQPGNRSVTSYHSHMQLSHRGGRLT
jgi:hypothetical protein